MLISITYYSLIILTDHTIIISLDKVNSRVVQWYHEVKNDIILDGGGCCINSSVFGAKIRTN